MPQPGQLSPDGQFMWNGGQWISSLSADGAYRWDGGGWVPTGAAPPPPGYAARAGAAAGAVPVAGGLGYQFGGSAAWSIGFGLASIVLPFFTPFYFPILPIFGIWRAFIAFRSGRVVGAAIGLVVNLAGAAVSLLASGLLG